MGYLEEWEAEENELVPDDWTEEDKIWWNKFLPFLQEALYESSMDEVREMEALPDIDFEISDDFKRSMNKIFRDAFGEDCKVPHPEVEQLSKSVNF